MTTKGLRHIQMQENAVREQVQLGFITVEHIGGKQNLADAFTKEEKDTNHFITCRDLLVSSPPSNPHINNIITDKVRSCNNIQQKQLHTINNSRSTLRDARDTTVTSSPSYLLRQARGGDRLYAVRWATCCSLACAISRLTLSRESSQ
jgi:hypothetical protein